MSLLNTTTLRKAIENAWCKTDWGLEVEFKPENNSDSLVFKSGLTLSGLTLSGVVDEADLAKRLITQVKNFIVLNSYSQTKKMFVWKTEETLMAPYIKDAPSNMHPNLSAYYIRDEEKGITRAWLCLRLSFDVSPIAKENFIIDGKLQKPFVPGMAA